MRTAAYHQVRGLPSSHRGQGEGPDAALLLAALPSGCLAAHRMTATALVYGASVVLAAVYILATVGILCVLGEAVCRIARLHRAGMARVRASR